MTSSFAYDAPLRLFPGRHPHPLPLSPSLSAISLHPFIPLYGLSLLPSTLSPFHSLDAHLTRRRRLRPIPAVVYVPYLSNYCRGPRTGPVAVIYRMLISG